MLLLFGKEETEEKNMGKKGIEEAQLSDREERIVKKVEKEGKLFQDLALAIHKKPEVSNYEFFASEELSKTLSSFGFSVEMPAAGHRTGFAASYKSKKKGPVVVFLAEYDALEGLGHGCGHNLFGTTASLSAVALKEVIDEVGGEIRVYGTPGEEGGEEGSAKGSFVREGYFKDVDFALCAHPADEHKRTGRNLGCVPVDIEFWGKSAHAAGEPEEGINALDALIQTYNSINALRQHLTDDTRIHGVILSGGSAPNVVPDYAHAKFYLRTSAKPSLEALYKKVENVVAGSALSMGAKGKMQAYQNWVENIVPTPSFDDLYEKHLNRFGEKFTPCDWKALQMGSSDVGNVSQVVPTIQPSICISKKKIPAHSPEFVKASCSSLGLESILLGAKVLAFTALELFEEPETLKKIKAEHKEQVKRQLEF